jgi:hypothetical protein
MTEQRTYTVYFHANAIEVLGEAFKPFLLEGVEGPRVLCKEIDTAGSFCEMTVVHANDKGVPVECEVMVPSAMIRLVVGTSSGAEVDFGFG